MWVVDSNCSRCVKKNECEDRLVIISRLSILSNDLNTEEKYIEGPGDGRLVMVCADFVVE